MHETHSLDDALQHAIQKMCADSGTIHIKDSDELVLHLAASHNVPEAVLSVIREIPWGKGMAGIAAQKAEPVDYCNIQTSTSPGIHAKARHTGMLGSVVVPMMHGSEVLGTLGVGCKSERTFSANEIRWLLDLGRQLANEHGDEGEGRLAA